MGIWEKYMKKKKDYNFCILSQNMHSGFVWCTSWRQQGKKQLLHLRGRDKVITSCPMLSWIWSRKERTDPQNIRLQKLLSSAAKNTCCPKLFFTTYWLLVSHPMRTVREREQLCLYTKDWQVVSTAINGQGLPSISSTFWWTRSWSTCDKQRVLLYLDI